VKVWDAQTGQLALSLKAHSGGYTCVCFSPDGKRLAAGYRTLVVWTIPPPKKADK
jgi:WD40 repeat protein